MKPAGKKKEAPRRSVVIVDDQESYADLLAQMISEKLDCPVHSFTNPVEALGRLGKLTAGVVVTDYVMPEMNGIEFIRQAAKVAPESAFIMISGQDLDPLGDQLSRLKGLKMRMQKPFGWRLLTDAVLRVWPGKDVPASLA